MAPLPIIPNCFRVTLNWTNPNFGQTAHNVMHFSNTTGNESDVFNDMNAHVTAAMWDFVVLGSNVTSLDIIALGHSFTSVHFPIAGAPTKWAGAGGGTDMIPQGAGVVTWRTNLRGRSYRGRSFLPWVAEQEQAFGNLSDVSACQTGWNSFLTSMSATPTNPVVASYKHATYNGVSSFVVRSKLRTQRRRNLK